MWALDPNVLFEKLYLFCEDKHLNPSYWALSPDAGRLLRPAEDILSCISPSESSTLEFREVLLDLDFDTSMRTDDFIRQFARRTSFTPTFSVAYVSKAYALLAMWFAADLPRRLQSSKILQKLYMHALLEPSSNGQVPVSAYQKYSA